MEEQLPRSLTKPPNPLLESIQKQIIIFPNNLGVSTTPRCEEIDGKGTTLWNLCTRLRRNYDLDKPQDVPLILLLTRVFAFLLLDCALENGKGATANLVRLMKVGIKAAKNCIGMCIGGCVLRPLAYVGIDRKQPDLSLKVLEKLGKYELLLLKSDGEDRSEDAEDHQRLIAEYYVLRTALVYTLRFFFFFETYSI